MSDLPTTKRTPRPVGMRSRQNFSSDVLDHVFTPFCIHGSQCWIRLLFAMMSSDRIQEIPISLGKPSFRRRLEDFYSLVAPDQLQNDWPKRFMQIWDIYGGSHEREKRLALKLAKKYGTTVCFLTVASFEMKQRGGLHDLGEKDVFDLEEMFRIQDCQIGSGVLDCLALKFDPQAVLNAPEAQIYKSNPWMASSITLLDRVEMFRHHLPASDPLYTPKIFNKRREGSGEKAKPKPISALALIATPLEHGPFSVLHKCMMDNKRVRVLVRYVNCIRGTLTGYVVGFDKHMNMILRDVEEVYTPRLVETADQTNVAMELERRRRGASRYGDDKKWTLRQRHLKQILVRGDIVVSVYIAEHELSAWPSTWKSPANTIYRVRTARKQVQPSERVGTPGSLLFAFQRKAKAHRRVDHPLTYEGDH